MKKVQLSAARPWTLLRNTHGDQKLIGYARVSTREQNLDSQLVRLRELQCGRIYAEKVSGTSGQRPGWNALLDDLRAGDVVLVLRVDRLGRRLSELVKSVEALREQGAHLRSIEEAIDTTQKGARFAFNIVASFAEKARDDISENTKAGLAAAIKRGRQLGRPTVVKPALASSCAHLSAQGFSLREIAEATGVGRTTVSKALRLATALRGDPRQMRLTGTEANTNATS